MNGDGPAPRIGQPYFDAILDEQKSRWDRGERPLVEDLLARHPTLGEDAEATLDVIYQEFVIRRALGESPSPEAYLRRFPAWADALVHQFAVDAALRPVNEVTVQPTDPGATGLGPLSTPDGIMPPAPLRSIDGHDILGELGRGGMGIDFKALDRRLNRVVAIKMVSETTFTAPAQLRRFLAEAEVIARLRHPNIIAIYAVGEERGRPYFSLELAEGGNLSERLAKGPITSRQAAELVETLAHAVSAAHAAGIIHRDLKPGNRVLPGPRRRPEDRRFRPGEAAERRLGAHAFGRGAGHTQLHGAGAGRGALAGCGTGRRHLRARGDPLPGINRPSAFPGCLRDRDDEAGRFHQGGGAPPAAAGRPARPRADHAEMPGEGPAGAVHRRRGARG